MVTVGCIFHVESPEKSLWGDISGWRNVLSKLKVDFYIVVDDDRIIPNWEDKVIESYRVDTLDEALELLEQVHPECNPVYFDKNGVKFTKQTQSSCFIFGSDHLGGLPNNGNKVKLINKDLWAVNCACIALYIQKET